MNFLKRSLIVATALSMFHVPLASAGVSDAHLTANTAFSIEETGSYDVEVRGVFHPSQLAELKSGFVTCRVEIAGPNDVKQSLRLRAENGTILGGYKAEYDAGQHEIATTADCFHVRYGGSTKFQVPFEFGVTASKAGSGERIELLSMAIIRPQ